MIFTRKSGQRKGYIHIITLSPTGAKLRLRENIQTRYLTLRKLRVQFVLSNFDKKIFILNNKCARNNYIKLLQDLN